MVTLAHLIAHIDELDSDFAIYAAQQWCPSSFAVVAREPDDGSLPSKFEGVVTFMMSVETAQALVSSERANHTPSLAELCEAVIYHAIYDAPPPRASQPSGMTLLSA